MSPATVKFT